MRTSLATVLLIVLALARTAAADLPVPHAGGDAAVIYWQAFAVLPQMAEDEWAQRQILLDPVDAPINEKVAAMVLKAQAALLQLRRAAKLDRADWQVDRQAGYDALLPHVFKARRLAQYAVLSARLKLSGGDAGEGVADLLAALRLARHIGGDPYFAALIQQFDIEGNVFRTAAANLKNMDAAAMRNFLAGLESLPKGGSMAAVMADSRQRVAGLVKDLEGAKPTDQVCLLAAAHFGEQTANALDGESKAQLLAELKALLALADRSAAAMQIPDSRIDRFEPQRAKLEGELGKFLKDHPELAFPAANCCDFNDRYLEAKVRVLQPMLRAAIAYRQEGKAAFAKVLDPYGDGPFQLTLSEGKARLASKLRLDTTVIEQTFTLPTAKQ